MAIIVSATAGPSVSARACSDLRADVASYVMAEGNNRALSKANDFLRDAVDELNTWLWPWAVVYQDIPLVVNQFDYNLAAPFKAPKHAQLLDVNSNPAGFLTFMDMKTFSILNPSAPTAGAPGIYTVYNAFEYGTISLNLAPTSDFVRANPTLRLFFYQLVQPCGGSVSSIDIPSSAASFLLWRAKEMMAAHFDPAKAGYAKGRADLMWRNILGDAARGEYADWES